MNRTTRTKKAPTLAAQHARKARKLLEYYDDWDLATEEMDQDAVEPFGQAWQFQDNSIAIEWRITKSIIVARGYKELIAVSYWQDR